MTGLIKAGSAGTHVRPFGSPLAAAPMLVAVPADADPKPDLQAENAGLQKRLAEAAEALQALETRLGEESERAAAEGRLRAEEADHKAAQERLEALRLGLDAADEAWRVRLAELDGLAALLARTALSKVFEPFDDQADAVVRILRRQLEGLEREAVLGVKVSAADFPDAAALAALAGSLAPREVALEADPELQPGQCRIGLRLGHVDVGLAAQWHELAALLDAFAAGGGR